MTKEKKTLLVCFLILFSLPVYLIYEYRQDYKSEKMLQKYGVETECVVIAYSKGESGVRGPKKGYYNKCEYSIDKSINYCYIFTSIKPLPFGTKILLKYYKMKNGTVKIDFPEINKFKEYGFNDYGY